MCDISDDEARQMFDAHAKKGVVQKRELRKMIRKKKGGDKCQGGKNREALNKFFDKLDEDGDGTLDFEEFKKHLHCIQQAQDGVPLDQIKCHN